MHVCVQRLSGDTLVLYVEPRDTIEGLKQSYQDKTGTPAHQMRLIFMGEMLDDGRTLSDCNIQRDATVHLIHHLRGC